MNKIVTRPLKAFLCHASGDKPPVREFYKRLVFEGVDAWLDKEKLLPGQDWRVEIPQAVKEADVVIVFLSKKSVSKEGYVQKEIKFALDIAEEKPDGTIFLIPARLEECVVPERLSRWHWVDLYEEDGFIRLLRSLKLRANVVGATVETASYEDSDKEIEHRLEQLYTEGLAAFYTEDWDRACQRFQTIISEYPDHKNAAEKMTEAERQRSLARLYVQAVDGCKAEDWQAAIRSLEELLQKTAEYKDAAQLLRNARKQKQLKELYSEAKTLHTAQKWHAVLKVFEQITTIETNYPDSDGLFPSAQKEVMELKRLADLNDLYGHAVREMDAGHWLEARRLLEQIHKAQAGFLETEQLLRKVEVEITKLEEYNKRNDQVNVLYEQAHGLFRSKKWRKAVEKLEELKKLNEGFVDIDEVFTKAKAELEREDKETQRQNELAAMYAEAVRLLQEGKYQEALDKWLEVKAVDPKYPDRQWVQRTTRKRLAGVASPIYVIPRFTFVRSRWIKIVASIVVFVLAVSVVALLVNRAAYPSMHDDFNYDLYDNSYNHDKWAALNPNLDGKIYQQDDRLVLIQSGLNEGQHLAVNNFVFPSTKVVSIQADLTMDAIDKNASIELHALTTKRGIICGLQIALKQCFFESYSSNLATSINSGFAQMGRPYTFHIEIDHHAKSALFFIDGDQIGSIVLAADEQLTGVMIGIWNPTGLPAKGYIDNVIIETHDSP